MTALAQILHSPDVQRALLRSLALSLTVALGAGLLGGLMAWLVTRARFAGSELLSGLLSVPYAIPAYLLGMAWVVLGNPTVGLLRAVFPQPDGIYGFWGMAWVELSVAFAFPFLELKAGFEKMDSSLEEAAQMSGAGVGRIFRDISLPLLWPALLNGLCLAFLYTLSSFGVPAILGGPVRQFVLTTLIYSDLKLGGMAGVREAIALSLLLLAIAAAVLVLSAWGRSRQKKRGLAIMGAKSSRRARVSLGALSWPVSVLSWSLLGVFVLLPWLALGLSALSPLAGQFAPSGWTLKNLRYVLALPEFNEALFNSLSLGIGVALLVVAGGFVLSFAAARRGSRLARAVIELLGLPFATPGTVLAIAVLLASSFVSQRLGKEGIDFDSPLFWIALAYAIKYAAVSARLQLTAFSQVHPALEEAARLSGAGTVRLLFDIWLPILRQTLLAAFLLAALPMLTELTMSVLLTGPGAATLGTVLFNLQEYADQPSAAALAWLLLTAAIVISFLTRFRFQKRSPAHEP